MTTRRLAPWLALLLAPLAGCALDPPVQLEHDPEHSALPRPNNHLIVVAPVVEVEVERERRERAARVAVVTSGSVAATSTADLAAGLAPVGSAGVATAGSGDFPARPSNPPLAALPAREVWLNLPTELDALQARVIEVTGWALGKPPRALRSSVALASGEGERDRLLGEAEREGGDLLLEVEVGQSRAAWVDRDGASWWLDAIALYGFGIPTGIFVSDELYEVALPFRARVTHVRSGRELLARSFVARDERSLTDGEAGWTLGGFFQLRPWTLDDADLASVHEALWPHVQKDLERQLSEWLTRELPPRVGSPGGAELLATGDPARARTWAIVAGAPGPAQTSLDRPPPIPGASVDAEAFAKALYDGGEVVEPAGRDRGPAAAPAPSRLTLLRDARASRTSLLAALTALRGKVLGSDRLVVYYAGQGLFDIAGRAALLLDGDTLTIEELAGAIAAAAPRAEVVIVLDTSFAGSAGRSHPAAQVSEPELALRPLQRARWQVLAAAGPKESAQEGAAPGGALTTWLVHGVQGPADADGDGAVTMGEAERHLQRWLVPDVRERLGAVQRPRRLGDAPEARLLRVPPLKR